MVLRTGSSAWQLSLKRHGNFPSRMGTNASAQQLCSATQLNNSAKQLRPKHHGNFLWSLGADTSEQQLSTAAQPPPSAIAIPVVLINVLRDAAVSNFRYGRIERSIWLYSHSR